MKTIISLLLALSPFYVSFSHTVNGQNKEVATNHSPATDIEDNNEQLDYQQLVIDYADAMIEHGRDCYGDVYTPLFAAALSRETLQLGSREEFGGIDGVRDRDRSLSGANPWDHLAIYSLMYQLSEKTGELHYANSADEALEYFFKNTQSAETGLMAWGDHLFWDFRADSATWLREGGDDHEFAGEWPYWDEVYQLAPDAAWRYALGLWDHQVYDQETGNFSRHAGYSAHGPEPDSEFPRAAGQLISVWADAWSRQENADRARRYEMLDAVRAIVGRMERNMETGTGYLRAHAGADYVWPFSNIELARNLWKSAPLIKSDDEELYKRMLALALRQDINFFKAPHKLIKNDFGFATTLHTETGEPRHRSMNIPYSSMWSTGYGHGSHAEYGARLVGQHFQLIKEKSGIAQLYKSFALEVADQYLSVSPDPEELVLPRAVSNIIALLIDAYYLTGSEHYLERADYFGKLGVEMFLEEGNPLPKASNHHQHYEAKTAGADLMLTLFVLHHALEGGENPPDHLWGRKRDW